MLKHPARVSCNEVIHQGKNIYTIKKTRRIELDEARAAAVDGGPARQSAPQLRQRVRQQHVGARAPPPHGLLLGRALAGQAQLEAQLGLSPQY